MKTTKTAAKSAPARKTSRAVSERQRAAAHKAWQTRRYAEMVARQDGIEEALEAAARGLN